MSGKSACSLTDEVWCVGHECQFAIPQHSHATSYQVKPSEYAYQGDSVNGIESSSASSLSLYSFKHNVNQHLSAL